MELAILLLALFLAGQKNAQKQDLPPLELLQGDWKALVHSEWFGRQTLGGVSGKEIAQAADAVETLQKYGGTLKPLLSGDFSALFTAGRAGPLNGLGELASLLQGAGGADGRQTNRSARHSADAAESADKTPFAPIANIADAEIICALTRYFAA